MVTPTPRLHVWISGGLRILHVRGGSMLGRRESHLSDCLDQLVGLFRPGQARASQTQEPRVRVLVLGHVRRVLPLLLVLLFQVFPSLHSGVGDRPLLQAAAPQLTNVFHVQPSQNPVMCQLFPDLLTLHLESALGPLQCHMYQSGQPGRFHTVKMSSK